MLDERFKKMLDKKKGLSDVEKDAKMDVVGDLRDAASEHMKKRMGSLKKVTVASNSPEGLQDGLEKAEDIIGDQESPEVESSEQEPQEGFEGLDLDAINEKLQKLMDLKQQLEQKK